MYIMCSSSSGVEYIQPLSASVWTAVERQCSPNTRVYMELRTEPFFCHAGLKVCHDKRQNKAFVEREESINALLTLVHRHVSSLTTG